MKWFEETPVLTESSLEDHSPFEWALVGGLWVNINKGWEETTSGILIMTE